MSVLLQRWLRSLGMAGVLAIGVLAACAAFWASALRPVEDQLAAQRQALERLRARTPYQPVSRSGPAEELRGFYALFPDAGKFTDELEQLHRLARRAGVELEHGEYRLERPPHGLWAYRVTLPARGTYPQVRGFVGALLRDMPTAALEGLRFERKKAVDDQLDAQIRITLFARPSVESP